jgi:hypothetical protein
MIPILLPLALTLQIVGSDLPEDRAVDDESTPMWVLVLLNLFHLIVFPTIQRDRSKSICSSADVTDVRRASGRASR